MSDVVLPRWVLVVAAVVVLLCMTAFIGSLVIAYIDEEFVSPSFNEESVPPPRSY